MGLFKKELEAEGEHKIETVEPEIPADANWHYCVEKASESVAENDVIRAVKLWTEAVDRYSEDTPKLLTKLRGDIYDVLVRKMVEGALAGQLIPGQMVAEIDLKGVQKHEDVWRPLLCTDIFYFAKEQLDKQPGPAATTYLYVSGAYGIVGYLRYCSDLKEALDKCREAASLGMAAARQCKEYPRGYAGHINPKIGSNFCLIITTYFKKLGDKLEMATADLSYEEIQRIKAYRTENRGDRMAHLYNSLQMLMNMGTTGRMKSKKRMAVVNQEMDAFIAEFMDTGETPAEGSESSE